MDSSSKLRWGAACLNCRKYKIRCDGEKPICGRCAQFGRADCAYGRGPPPSLDARLQEQFSDFGQRVNIIAPAGYQAAGQAASSSNSSRPQTTFTLRDAVPVEFPGPNEIFGLASWNQRSEIPVYTRQHMLEILIPQRSQFSMDFHYSRWRRAIMLPASDPNSFHPSLVYAIALAAASLCGPALQPYEPIFRSHAEAHLEDSIAFADRVEDSMWARVILAWHSMRHGKHMAALHMSTANVSLAVGANLHTLPDPSYFNQVPHSLLPPPINKQHAIERGNLWWSIYLIDCQLAVSLNVQGQIYLDPLDANSITTRLPMPFDITPGQTRPCVPQLANELLTTGCQWLQDDTLFCLRVKAAILIHVTGATVAAVTSAGATPQVWERFVSLERATAAFVPAMPPLEDMRGTDGSDTAFRFEVNPTLIHTATSVLLASLLLAGVRAPNDVAHQKKRVDLAMAGADLARRLGDVSRIYTHVAIGTSWYAMAEALIDELVRTGASDARSVRAIRASLRIFMDKLAKLQGFYSGLRPYIEYIDAEFLSSPSRTAGRASPRTGSRVSPFSLD